MIVQLLFRCAILFREKLMKAFCGVEFALRRSKTVAKSCASTGGAKETLI
jgi:hypothetical protein